MKAFKFFIAINIILLSALGVMAADKKKKVDPQAFEKIVALMESREYYLEVDGAYPTGNSSITINSKYGQKVIGNEGYISLITNRGEIFFLGDVATGHLPFFGRAYQLPYGEGGGIEFERATLDKESFKVVNKKKKQYVEYKFSVRSKNGNDVFNFHIEVYSNGNCTVNLTSNNRASISYSGKVSQIPEDKKEFYVK